MDIILGSPEREIYAMVKKGGFYFEEDDFVPATLPKWGNGFILSVYYDPTEGGYCCDFMTMKFCVMGESFERLDSLVVTSLRDKVKKYFNLSLNRPGNVKTINDALNRRGSVFFDRDDMPCVSVDLLRYPYDYKTVWVRSVHPQGGVDGPLVLFWESGDAPSLVRACPLNELSDSCVDIIASSVRRLVMSEDERKANERPASLRRRAL